MDSFRAKFATEAGTFHAFGFVSVKRPALPCPDKIGKIAKTGVMESFAITAYFLNIDGKRDISA